MVDTTEIMPKVQKFPGFEYYQENSSYSKQDILKGEFLIKYDNNANSGKCKFKINFKEEKKNIEMILEFSAWSDGKSKQLKITLNDGQKLDYNTNYNDENQTPWRISLKRNNYLQEKQHLLSEKNELGLFNELRMFDLEFQTEIPQTLLGQILIAKETIENDVYFRLKLVNFPSIIAEGKFKNIYIQQKDNVKNFRSCDFCFYYPYKNQNKKDGKLSKLNNRTEFQKQYTDECIKIFELLGLNFNKK